MPVLALLLVLAVCVAFVLLLLPLPAEFSASRWPALVQELENLLHVPLFAVLSAILFRILRARWPLPARMPYLVTLAGAGGLGLATEGLQGLVGRDAAWIDLANDLAGAGIALLLCAHFERRREGSTAVRGFGALPAALALGLLAAAPFLWTLAAYGFRTTQVPVLWRAESALFGRFSHHNLGQYPGLELREPSPDWSTYNRLALEIRNDRGDSLDVTVRVHDRAHDGRFDDRFNRTFTLKSGPQTLRIPLAQVRAAPLNRAMDLATISGVIVFQADGSQTPGFTVMELRLERQEDAGRHATSDRLASMPAPGGTTPSRLLRPRKPGSCR